MAGIFGHPNPFAIRHSKAAGAKARGKQLRLGGGRGTAQLTWEKRDLPGAGAQQYATPPRRGAAGQAGAAPSNILEEAGKQMPK